MAVGVPGANGADALRSVGLEHNTAADTAINQDQHMEERAVLDKVDSRGNAMLVLAQVGLEIINNR